MVFTVTHTYAILEVTEATFEEILNALYEAGYDHLIHVGEDGKKVIDMAGLALKQTSL